MLCVGGVPALPNLPPLPLPPPHLHHLAEGTHAATVQGYSYFRSDYLNTFLCQDLSGRLIADSGDPFTFTLKEAHPEESGW